MRGMTAWVLVAACCGTAWADTTGPERLVALDAGGAAVIDAVPRVARAGSGPGSVTLDVVSPAVRVADAATRQGSFTVVTLAGCGPGGAIGEPRMPVIRRLVVAPKGAQVAVTVTSAVRQMPVSDLGPAGRLMPRQAPVPKLPNAAASAPFALDAAAYAADSWYPREQARVTEAGVFAGRRLVMIEIAPVQYNPARAKVACAGKMTVTVSFSGGTAATQPLSSREDMTLAGRALNHQAATRAAAKGGRLLAIAAASLVTNLDAYVAHKAARGWTVATNAVALGTSANAIRSFIVSAYTNSATKPDMVVLVGDTALVPCFTGIREDNPDTDLYYGCMDGLTDWQPEFPVGRISVGSAAQLDAVLAKTMAYETSSSGDWLGHATFMASEDNYTVSEGTHNWVIDAFMTSNGYVSDKLYCHSYTATPAQVSAAFNAGRALGIYSGHGSETYWADGPVFYQSDVEALTNAGKYPFVCSFACYTGEMSFDECFAETWLRAPGKAGVNVWASSVTSYWDEDDTLERGLFRALFDQNALEFGAATFAAKQSFLLYYGTTEPTTRRYFEQYNMFGDPSVRLVLPVAITTSSPLPTGFVDEPYECTLAASGGMRAYMNWSVIAGALPDGLALAQSNGVISGIPLEETSTVFTVSVTDAAGTMGSAALAMTVSSRLRMVAGVGWATKTNLPDAVLGAPYSTGLDAAGGVPPYTWQVMPKDEWYAEQTTNKGWKGKGTAQHWHDDDASWPLVLAWPFPFYGQARTSLWVSSNGFVDFGSGSPDPDNTESNLAAHARIAPLWMNLTTKAGGNNIYVYIHPTATFSSIRWKARTVPGNKPVNAELLLFSNGVIRFNYNARNRWIDPVIGVSKGDGVHYTLSARSGTNVIPRKAASVVTYGASYPAGLVLTNGNMLAGTPTALGSYALVIGVTDVSAPPQSVTNTCMLEVVPEPAAAVVLLLASLAAWRRSLFGEQ